MDRRRIWRKRGALLLTGAAALCMGAAWAWQRDLTVTEYEVELPVGLEGLDGMKLVQIADLHSADFRGQLEGALGALAPDMIVITGDLVNREDRDLGRALSLAAAAAKTAPTYFTPGNHEADNPCYSELKDGLKEAGVVVLEHQAATLEWNGALVNVIGMEDLTFHLEGREAAQRELPGQVQSLCAEGAFNILLSHRPSLMEEYAGSGADLVFSGHAHGGQVRLPLAGPLFAPDEGILPRYTDGVYSAGRTQVVVSRGLGNGTPFPRLWNGPELVLVTLRAG